MIQMISRIGRLLPATFATLVALLPTAAFAQVVGEPGFGLPRDISKWGHLIDAGLNFGNIAITLLFLMVFAWLVIAYTRHDKNHKAKYDHGNTTRAAYLVAGFTLVIFLVLDGHHYYASVTEIEEHFWAFKKVNAKPNVLKVEVNARQWAWEFRYAGEDNQFATKDDVVTLNDFQVPAGRPVLIQLRSVDVIHALYIPNVRMKIDAVPGLTNYMTFEVDPARLAQAGSTQFDIGCAQHCGTHHYKMKAEMTVHANEADFNAWMKEAAINAGLDYVDAPEDPLLAKYEPHWGWEWVNP